MGPRVGLDLFPLVSIVIDRRRGNHHVASVGCHGIVPRHLLCCAGCGGRLHLGEPSNFRWPPVTREPASASDPARGGRGLVAAMTDLFLQPTGSPTQYEVIADAQIVGRITLSSSLRHHSKPWVWSIALAFSDGHDPVHVRGHTRRGDARIRTQLVRREPTVKARVRGGWPTVAAPSSLWLQSTNVWQSSRG